MEIGIFLRYLIFKVPSCLFTKDLDKNLAHSPNTLNAAKVRPNKKNLKSLLSILDTMEWSNNPSQATIPLKWEVQRRPIQCPSLILFERGTPDLQRTPELHAGGAEAAGGQD
jgi:hypothetical protein